jgi:hypothetical protein
MFKKIIFNNRIKNFFFMILVFISGIISFVGYLNGKNEFDILLLMYAYINPFYSIITLVGQLCSIVLCNIYYTQFKFLQQSFHIYNIITIIVLRIFVLFIYSCFFQKLIDKWKINKIINVFICISLFTIIIQFILVILFYIIEYIPLKQINNFNVYIKLLQITKYNIVHYYIADIKTLLHYYNIGMTSMMINVSLFIHSAFSSLFLSLLNNDFMNKKFHKLDHFNTKVSSFYQKFFLTMLFFTAIFWFLQFYFLALLFYSMSLSLLFLFFILGRNILLQTLLYYVNNIIMVYISMMIIMNNVPMVLVLLIILGIIETIFNFREL